MVILNFDQYAGQLQFKIKEGEGVDWSPRGKIVKIVDTETDLRSVTGLFWLDYVLALHPTLLHPDTTLSAVL